MDKESNPQAIIEFKDSKDQAYAEQKSQQIVTIDEMRVSAWRIQRFRQKFKKIKKKKPNVVEKLRYRRAKRNKSYEKNQKRRAKIFEQIKQQLSIRKIVIHSIKNFISKNYLKIKIKVIDNQLFIDMDSILLNFRQSVFSITNLKTQVKKQLAHSVVSQQEIEDISVDQTIVQMFQSLLKLFKYTLNRKIKTINNADIDSIDFFCLPLSKCQESLSPRIPIFIGGFRFTCMRFFRKLIEMILNLQDILISDIASGLATLIQHQKVHLIQVLTTYVNSKLSFLRSYINVQQTQQIRSEMQSKFFIQVLNQFRNNVYMIAVDQNGVPQRFNRKSFDHITIQSRKLHTLRKTFYNIHGGSFDLKANHSLKNMEVKLINFFVSKKFYSKNACEKQEELQYLSQLFNNYILSINQNEYLGSQKILFHGQNIHQKVEFLLFQSRQFYLYGTQKQKCQYFLKKIENHFNMSAILKCQSYCYQGKLGIKCLPTILQNIPCFKGKLSGLLRTKIREAMLTSKRLKIQDRISIQRRFQPNESENQILSKLKFQQYVRYHHKDDQNSKQEVTIDITTDGDVRIIGNIIKKKAEQLLYFIRSKIQEQINLQYIKKKILIEQVSRYYSVILSGNNHKRQNVCHLMEYAKKGTIQLSHYDKFTIRSIELQRGLGQKLNSLVSGSSLECTLKLAVWNIEQQRYQGLKKYPFNPPQRRKRFVKWYVNRLNQILKKIKSENPDFVCLQEASQLFDDYTRNYNNKESFDWFFKYMKDQQYQFYYVPQKHKHVQGEKNKYFYRSVIFSKIPVNFYDIQFPQLNSKILSVCSFDLQVKQLSEKKFSVILASIHLKSGGPSKRYSRQSQLRIFKQISKNFDITILAGDFNIGQDQNQYPENKMLESYIDTVKFLPNEQRPITWIHNKGEHGNNRMDRILIKFGKNEQCNKLANSLSCRMKIIGNQPCAAYEDIERQEAEKNKKSLTLSDHYGISVQIMFQKPSTKKMIEQ